MSDASPGEERQRRLELKARRAEGNLLFYVFAVQLGYVSAEQVMAASGAWAADPTRRFVDRLAFEGSLSGDKRKRLDAMVRDALDARAEPSVIDLHRGRPPAWEADLRPQPDPRTQAETAPAPLAPLGEIEGADWASPLDPPTADPLPDLGAEPLGDLLPPIGPDLGAPPLAPITPPRPETLREAPLSDLGAPAPAPGLKDIGGADTAPAPASARRTGLMDIGELADSMALSAGVSGIANLDAMTRDYADRITAEHPGRYTYRSLETDEETEDRTLAELGRGGIGRVLRAHDTHLGREVALKELLLTGDGGSSVPSPSGRSMTGAAARFLREARVTGQLEHPNIVPVYELGERPDGTFYYSMKLVRGRTLEDALAESKTLDDRLRLLGHFSDVCQAIAYAHSRGVVHRDLKPQNIMVGEFGETLVLDWGLAKVRGKRDIRGGELRQEIRGMQDAPGNQTMVGSALGTPAYMSPEQAIGEVDQIDERSDVWGLGAILYELLTGRPPFGGATPFEIIGKVMKDPVVPVRERTPDAPADLAAVCEKALTRAKKKRYQSAGELASEIVAWQGGARVGAYTYTSMDLLKRFASRNKLPLVTAAVGLALLIIAGVAGFLEVRAERDVAEAERENAGLARDQAVVEQARAASERDKARHHLAEVLGEKARSYAESDDAVLAEIYAAAALGLGERPEARGVLATTWNAARPELGWQSPRGARCAALAVDPRRGSLICAETTGLGIVGWDLDGGLEQLRLVGHDGPVGALVLAPADGVAGRRLVSGGADGTVRLWNVGAGAQLARLEGHEGAVTGLALTGDGARLVSGGADGTVRVWDLAEAFELQQLGPHPGGVNAVAVLGELALSAGADGVVRAWAPGAQAATWEAMAHAGGVAALAVDPVHHLVASGGADGQVAARDGRTGALVGSFKAGEAGVSALAFSRAGLVVATADGAVRSWDPTSGTLVRALTALASPVIALVADGEGKLLAGSTEQGDVVTWDPASGEHSRRLEGLLGLADRVAFSADGREVAVVGQRQSVRVYDRATGRETARLYGPERPWTLGFSPVGRRLVVGTVGGQALVWDLDLNREVLRIAAHKGVTISAAFGPTGERIVTGGSDQVVALWDATTGAALVSHTEHTGRVARALISPDGRQIASGGHDSRVMVWDIETQTRTVELDGHSDWLRDLAWSPDGSRLVTASDDFSARVWDVAAGRELVRLSGHAGRVFGAVFAPGGELVITGSDDRTIRVWEAGTGLEIARLIGHAREVRSVALAPDGTALASGDVGATMRLWTVPPQRVGRRFQGDAIVRALSLSPDATRLAAEGGSGQVQVWNVQSEEVEAVLPGHGTMIEALAFSPDGGRLLTGDHEGGLRMWQMPAGERVWEDATPAKGVTSMAWAPDGERVWTARTEPTLQARSRATGEVVAEYTGHTKDVYALALSPDGKMMASAGTGRVIRLWSPQTLDHMGTLDEPTRLVVDLAMSGDGGRLAATSFEGDVRLWDLQRQALVRTILGEGVRSHAVAFSPDDRLLAIAYADGRIEVVDVATGDSRMTLTGHHTYSPLAFFPDGSTLVSATLGNRLRLYAMAALDAQPEVVLARAEEAFGVRLVGTRVEPDPTLARTRLLPVVK